VGTFLELDEAGLANLTLVSVVYSTHRLVIIIIVEIIRSYVVGKACQISDHSK
jgi:hypothetical protein